MCGTMVGASRVCQNAAPGSPRLCDPCGRISQVRSNHPYLSNERFCWCLKNGSISFVCSSVAARLHGEAPFPRCACLSKKKEGRKKEKQKQKRKEEREETREKKEKEVPLTRRRVLHLRRVDRAQDVG